MNLLSEPAPSAAAIAGFVAVVAAVAGVAIAGVSAASRAAGDDDTTVARLRRSTALGLAAWLAVTGALAAAGLLHFGFVPPPLMPLVLLSLILSTTLACSRFGARLAAGVPIAALVGFQAFRLPLELVLHQLSLDGVLPVQMTYSGMNYDIATGVSAIVVALWAATGTLPRIVLLLWNILGLVLLLAIVTIAILSMPAPFRAFANDPANTIVATFPFVWLPTVLVQAAWIGHLLVFRRLRLERR